MSSGAAKRAVRALGPALRGAAAAEPSAAAAAAAAPAAAGAPPPPARAYGSVPEHWGRDSPYHGGTEFLGTPKNHLELVARRPLSPHVFELGGRAFHYKMPWGALSSIANRAAGVALTGAAAGAAYATLALGDAGAAVAALKAGHPLLVAPLKAAVAAPLVYHYAAAARHLYWEHYKYGDQTNKATPLEVPAVEASSKAVLFGSAAATAALALWST